MNVYIVFNIIIIVIIIIIKIIHKVRALGFAEPRLKNAGMQT